MPFAAAVLTFRLPPDQPIRRHFTDDAEVIRRRLRAELDFWLAPAAPPNGHWSLHGKVLRLRVHIGLRQGSRPASPWVLDATLTPAADGGSDLVGVIGVPRSLRLLLPVAVVLLVAELGGLLLWLLTAFTGPPALADWFSSLSLLWTLVSTQLVILLATSAWSGRRRPGPPSEAGPADQTLRALVTALADPNRRPGVLPSR